MNDNAHDINKQLNDFFAKTIAKSAESDMEVLPVLGLAFDYLMSLANSGKDMQFVSYHSIGEIDVPSTTENKAMLLRFFRETAYDLKMIDSKGEASQDISNALKKSFVSSDNSLSSNYFEKLFEQRCEAMRYDVTSSQSICPSGMAF